MVRSSSSAIGSSSCTRVSTSSLMNRLIMSAPPFSSVARDPAGGGCPGWYLPVSTPCAIGDQTIWLMPSSRQVGTTSASITRHSIEYCGWLEIELDAELLGQRVPGPDLLGGPLADADVERLALPDDVGERLHRLLERRLGVVPVRLVQVDVVGLQPAQRAVDRLHDVLAGQARRRCGPSGPVGQYTLVKISSDSRRSPFSASPSTVSAAVFA